MNSEYCEVHFAHSSKIASIERFSFIRDLPDKGSDRSVITEQLFQAIQDIQFDTTPLFHYCGVRFILINKVVIIPRHV